MDATTTQKGPTAQQQEIARRRERLEQSRREFLETINRQRGPSRGEVVETRDGFTRVTIVSGDTVVRAPAIREAGRTG